MHATDRKTLDAAVRGRGDSGLKLLGVTVLTNLDRADLSQQGIEMPPLALVRSGRGLRRTPVSTASWRRARRRRLCASAWRNFLIVTPGIRQEGAEARIRPAW